ncbi:MAG TPA: M24 family metallopeptidase [Chitinophagales bacterium]|nr:aminopeptidase P family protein [Chitinophagales bacterium]MCB0511503.1 aminopeptidase P family protein [Bacteroidota bacterium]HMU98123.1 M24 family metallopeptidase [Chitinophagales bacterium]HMV02996.1 M24 family metallopeptidase [Chitinophagales bacterium]HMW94539.1 M24 family metallopeptidase [Chitinophagales bacterium]
MSDSLLSNLIQAEQVAIELFREIELRNLIISGKDEAILNEEIYQLAKLNFGIEKHWHKRIVRCGQNTLVPYKENPPNLKIQDNDIIFLDFGPIIDNWEADLGRTFVVGNNPKHLKIKNEIEQAWLETKDWVLQQKELKASKLYLFVQEKAKEFGWEFGGSIAGHIIGMFPHEKLDPENFKFYIHPENHLDIFQLNKHWILEMHFIDKEQQFGAFYEQLML